MLKTTTKIVVACCLLIAAVFIAGCKKGDSTDPLTSTYSIVYDVNGGTGNPPDTLTLTATDLAGSAENAPGQGAMTGPTGRTTFGGWNTQADGNGTDVAGGAALTAIYTSLPLDPDRSITLYAKWS